MKLINRRALRNLLLEEYKAWGGDKDRKNVSKKVMDEIEEKFRRFIKTQAAQGLPGRSDSPVEPLKESA